VNHARYRHHRPARADLDKLPEQRDKLAADAHAVLDRSTGGSLSDEDKAEFERIETSLEDVKQREPLLRTLAGGRFGLEDGAGDSGDDDKAPRAGVSEVRGRAWT
jgi:hypothetical protein